MDSTGVDLVFVLFCFMVDQQVSGVTLTPCHPISHETLRFQVPCIPLCPASSCLFPARLFLAHARPWRRGNANSRRRSRGRRRRERQRLQSRVGARGRAAVLLPPRRRAWCSSES